MKLILDTEAMHEDFFSDSSLISIGCSLPIYRFCWLLNQSFNIELKRLSPEHDICVHTTPDVQHYYALYRYEVPNSSDSYTLYQIKNGNQTLLADLKNIDYILLLQGPIATELKSRFLQSLRTLSDIQLAQEVFPYQIKNIDYLLT